MGHQQGFGEEKGRDQRGSGSLVVCHSHSTTSTVRFSPQEYIDYYGGAGVQHIALNTSDIISAVSATTAALPHAPAHSGLRHGAEVDDDPQGGWRSAGLCAVVVLQTELMEQLVVPGWATTAHGPPVRGSSPGQRASGGIRGILAWWPTLNYLERAPGAQRERVG